MDATYILTGHDNLTMKKTCDISYLKSSSAVIVKSDLTIIQEGEEKKVKATIPTELDQKQEITLFLEKDNTTCILDTEEKIDSYVSSTVIRNKNTGELEQVTITGKNYEAVYAKTIEKQGLTMLKNLEIKTDQVESTFEYAFSDLVCVVDKLYTNKLNCEQDFTFTMKITDEVMVAEGISKQLNEAVLTTDSYLKGINVFTVYNIASYIESLDDIDGKLSTRGIKAELNTSKKAIAKEKKWLHDEKLDSLSYLEIRGTVVKKNLEMVKQSLENILKNLNNK